MYRVDYDIPYHIFYIQICYRSRGTAPNNRIFTYVDHDNFSQADEVFIDVIFTLPAVVKCQVFQQQGTNSP
jgi:hypothetical protein